MAVTVRFLGSGDSWGSGGRLQTCILVDGMGPRIVLDCGASALISMRQQQVDPNSIDAILLTHLHGDHCAGVPFLLMDAMLGSRRQRPLTIVGPPGCAAHVDSLKEALFPGSGVMSAKFAVRYIELHPGATHSVDGLEVSAFPALHTAETRPSMLRLAANGKIVTYTGDTDWTEALVAASHDADLLISECYFYDKPVKMHMSYATLQQHRHELSAKRLVLTHMSSDMLGKLDRVSDQCAYDGMVIEL